jgi:hypothetical protein
MITFRHCSIAMSLFLANISTSPIKEAGKTYRGSYSVVDIAYRSSGISFVWDHRKAELNLRKHGVAFETACEVFLDPFISLMATEVVRGEDLCSFADIIVRDVLYEEVSPFRRRKLHNTVGCALERVYAKKIDEHFGELALHFLESGEKDKALGYFLKAGDRAAKIYANSEAVSYFQHALSLLEKKEGGGSCPFPAQLGSGMG